MMDFLSLYTIPIAIGFTVAVLYVLHLLTRWLAITYLAQKANVIRGRVSKLFLSGEVKLESPKIHLAKVFVNDAMDAVKNFRIHDLVKLFNEDKNNAYDLTEVTFADDLPTCMQTEVQSMARLFVAGVLVSSPISLLAFIIAPSLLSVEKQKIELLMRKIVLPSDKQESRGIIHGPHKGNFVPYSIDELAFTTEETRTPEIPNCGTLEGRITTRPQKVTARW